MSEFLSERGNGGLSPVTPLGSPANAEAHAGPNEQDWCEIRETVRMLHLAVAHVQISMREGDSSVDTLTRSFTSMAEAMHGLRDALAEMPVDGPSGGSHHVDQCEAMRGHIQGAIVAFQFYDRLTQRMAHVRESLTAIAGLVESPERRDSPREWSELRAWLRSSYSMPEECAMFDALMAGMSVDAALEHFREARLEAEDADIELF